MKDDLTNKITGSITSLGGFPLVVKVDDVVPFFSYFDIHCSWLILFY